MQIARLKGNELSRVTSTNDFDVVHKKYIYYTLVHGNHFLNSRFQSYKRIRLSAIHNPSFRQNVWEPDETAEISRRTEQNAA